MALTVQVILVNKCCGKGREKQASLISALSSYGINCLASTENCLNGFYKYGYSSNELNHNPMIRIIIMDRLDEIILFRAKQWKEWLTENLHLFGVK